ncbi:GIN domain-containing protein [Sorangium sp. So ce1389]|uniref:GIN domain-containing protein n=1 Tax=Sorangium sp. So ce1389 TaxID=3133336 RepID=UPI003F6317A7
MLKRRDLPGTPRLINEVVAPLALTIAAASGCGTQASGELAQEPRTVTSSFTRIAFERCIDNVRLEAKEIRATAGAKPSVTVSGDSNMLDRIELDVKDSELHVSCKGPIDLKLGLTVRVEAPEIVAIRSGGNAELTLLGAEADSFDIKHEGSGKMNVQALRAKTLTVNVMGSASTSIEALGLTSLQVNATDATKLSLSGDARTVSLKVDESSVVEALDLKADEVHSSLVDASKATVCAKVALDGVVANDGRLEYGCQPPSVKVEKKDKGIYVPR